MVAIPDSTFRLLRNACAGVFLLGLAIAGTAQEVPIVQPGAPGQDARDLSADEAIDIADTSYSPDDVQFMQDMIPHHNQAVQMSALVPDRTNLPELRDVAGRIDASQQDEIEFMQQWLRERGEAVPEPTAHSAMHTSHDMAGMASPEDMARLAELEGTEFDRLFLTYMIGHHRGALIMVDELFASYGGAQDDFVFKLANDIGADQTSEIVRMQSMLDAMQPGRSEQR